jgi:peptide chain release factor subunit 1
MNELKGVTSSMLTDYEKFNFQKTIESLKSKNGQGTEMITLYVPAEKRMSDIISYLNGEYGSVANIKSKQTRNNVQDALTSIMSRLRIYGNVAPNKGLAVFSGSVDGRLDTTVIEPPEPVTSFSYRCGSTFETARLEDMLIDHKTYGLLVMDLREATIGLLTGQRIVVKKSLTSNVPGKQSRGGQSEHRFEELRKIAIHDYFKRLGEHCDEVFGAVPRDQLAGILVGGSPSRDDFAKRRYMHYELDQKIIDTYDTGYMDEFGLKELVERAGPDIESAEQRETREAIERFFRALATGNGLATYGMSEVREAAGRGAVKVLLVSTGIPGTVELDELVRSAGDKGAQIAFVSPDFTAGEQLKNIFGGVAAVLRYTNPNV